GCVSGLTLAAVTSSTGAEGVAAWSWVPVCAEAQAAVRLRATMMARNRCMIVLLVMRVNCDSKASEKVREKLKSACYALKGTPGTPELSCKSDSITAFDY